MCSTTISHTYSMHMEANTHRLVPVAEEECQWCSSGSQQAPPGLAAEGHGQQQQLPGYSHQPGQHGHHQPQRRLAQLQA